MIAKNLPGWDRDGQRLIGRWRRSLCGVIGSLPVVRVPLFAARIARWDSGANAFGPRCAFCEASGVGTVDSIRAAVEHYRVDMDHALKVRESAMVLFASLKSVHRLPPEYQEWLLSGQPCFMRLAIT
jgi:hypothetical protein